MKGLKILLITGITGVFILGGCSISEEEPAYGSLQIHFDHLVDGAPAEYDRMIYQNAAGNTYEITNIQWFVSDPVLLDESGSSLVIQGDSWIHYIDTDLPETMVWHLAEEIPAGEYSSIKLTFGIRGIKNRPNMFTDPPESNMLWPYHMGGDMGGYHYMKLNGFWINPDQERTPFNFHLGVGQNYDEQGGVTGFVQNWFEIILPFSGFVVNAGDNIQATIHMNIENWFKDPNIYDHNVYGGRIMDNQEAMGEIKENGQDVFTITFSENVDHER